MHTLLMMLLTATTAWADEYTVNYKAKISHVNSSLYNIILQRNDDSSLKATIASSSSAWEGNSGVCVNDEYDVTFKPSQNLSVATNPGTTTPQNSLTVDTKVSLTYNNTKYYKAGTTVTMNAPANHIIEAASGVSGATVASPPTEPPERVRTCSTEFIT